MILDEATRDFVDGELDPAKRRARLIPWIPQDLSDVSFTQVEPDISYFQVCCPVFCSNVIKHIQLLMSVCDFLLSSLPQISEW